jgi:hypothetical protein
MDLVAIAEYAARGKGYLVLLRPSHGRLAMHQLLHADEVRPVEEIPKPSASVDAGELTMARQLLEQMAAPRFDASRYSDEVRARVRELIQKKVEGADIVEEAPAEAPRGKVVDLMDALKASLEQGQKGSKAASSGRRPAAKAAPASAPPRRAQARELKGYSFSATATPSRVGSTRVRKPGCPNNRRVNSFTPAVSSDPSSSPSSTRPDQSVLSVMNSPPLRSRS